MQHTSQHNLQIFFTFLPLIILIIFNSLLIRSVLNAAKVRNLMTNNSPHQTTNECVVQDESKTQFEKSPRMELKASKEMQSTNEKETFFMKKKSKFLFNIRPKSQQNKDQQRITVMLIAVVVVFLLCQLPQAIQRILQEYIVSPHKVSRIVFLINNSNNNKNNNSSDNNKNKNNNNIAMIKDKIIFLH